VLVSVGIRHMANYLVAAATGFFGRISLGCRCVGIGHPLFVSLVAIRMRQLGIVGRPRAPGLLSFNMVKRYCLGSDTRMTDTTS
jgi:hypothetical protein